MYGQAAVDRYDSIGTPILPFNAGLERHAVVSSLNENVLEGMVSGLEALAHGEDALTWLTLGRILELALFCAGNYADTGEVRLVGDLLVNPRRVLVHVEGLSHPIVKERHTPLTEQFRDRAPTREGVVQWLTTHTLTEIQRDALLPFLRKRLEDSGLFHGDYLRTVAVRCEKIARVLGFWASAPFGDAISYRTWYLSAGPGDRALADAHRCRFDLERFLEMGADIRSLAACPLHRSRFLVTGTGRPLVG